MNCLLVAGSTLIGLPLSSTAGSAKGAPDCGPSGKPFNTKPVGPGVCVICGEFDVVDGHEPAVPFGRKLGRQRMPKNFIATCSTGVPFSGSCLAVSEPKSLLQSN